MDPVPWPRGAHLRAPCSTYCVSRLASSYVVCARAWRVRRRMCRSHASLSSRLACACAARRRRVHCLLPCACGSCTWRRLLHFCSVAPRVPAAVASRSRAHARPPPVRLRYYHRGHRRLAPSPWPHYPSSLSPFAAVHVPSPRPPVGHCISRRRAWRRAVPHHGVTSRSHRNIQRASATPQLNRRYTARGWPLGDGKTAP